MTHLTPDQRNYYYLLEADRAGIHKPILAALYRVHQFPDLADGEKGLGILPTPQVPEIQLNSFPKQVQYAANVVRAQTNALEKQGWQGTDIWNSGEGRYSDRFLAILADGYTPNKSDTDTAKLQPSDPEQLRVAYLNDIATEYEGTYLPQNLADLDQQLLALVERIPDYYMGLTHQRDALLEAVRLWRKLDTVDEALVSIANDAQIPVSRLDDTELDIALSKFIQRISPNYGGYPHQREALLRLTQLWRQLPSREAAIASLEKSSNPNPGLDIFDPALIAFVQRIPDYYEGTGLQRNALTEGFRIWRQLDSRSTAVAALGIDPNSLTANPANPETLKRLAAQLDRELLNFIRRVPRAYQETHQQREALIRLVQLWRGLRTRAQTLDSLKEDLKRLEQQRNPEPPVVVTPKRPDRWTPNNIQISASIIPNGNFTWAEATKGGTRMPPDQATVDAIVRIAQLAQQARDQMSRPFIVTSWYRPPHINRAVGGAKYSRHIVGDAIDFVCEGLSGNQLYWTLHPWWPGGLGRYTKYPNLCHIDARGHRSRWSY
ncbi:D-Ala-D-Ala carboxypeptidase family metallohydrolase [Spirulina sp. CS-785/01]|uniref:D-Ala-D-Ala carboxypeptidase family metallohydrolase n=1 Tax=Spirulina sp. CS-785/01 TaxID=3021716 RepID=UPI00232ED074|nr:D-Ala-D-Ala carboxypeptidase family metallohydrolase [Spirulina sp. CS-785/01]MDB9314919.1 D-Ala-D-Ala carboxypeptidase family metallohydrolase [Spirulina sp. CS-785/01]